ncbi:EAL domain-containing protein [Bacillus sp. EB106-08-02-XG196]|uniref:EAL domain-containing protein n=1 Tax=Bacillus sp. EB106-08-02-XG196 TaxID=2737049 RepID=UPI0015C41F2D|nr:EAL domain-containing protein [Bacillus sp. EB106-08-02-XG196]NWQ44410.1 EAL domain-containing protein [Bacillus sp. EB106-08-02-XG196]
MDNKINILLVDDRPENLLALEAIIEQEDYNLIKAFSGEEALKCLLKHDFAAILLDVQMPGIDGFGTAKIIKAREKTKNIPILFITANYMDSEHIFTGYSVGAIDYILKPFDPTILKAKVEGFVDLYKLNKQLAHQADSLREKTKEIEQANLELSKTAAELRVSEAISTVISETSIDTMVVIDENGIVLKVNPAVEKMFNYLETEIVNHPLTVLFSEEKSKISIDNILNTIKNVNHLLGYENLYEVTASRKDGSSFPVEIQIGKRYVQNRSLIAFTIRDITKKKQDQEKITHMAYHDSLTNLPNRRLFNEQLTLKLNEARQSYQPLVIMYVDMDRFKYINDSLGHMMGDRLLQEIAKRLSESVRKQDLVARVGGDEFTILLPGTDRESALEIAEEIFKVFKSPFYIDNYELFLTTCIGISTFPYDGEDSQVLLRNADAALYRAKEQGKNQYKVFHTGMNIQSYRTFIMQNDLRKAIKREELALVYQPKVEIESGTVKSAEALLRWNHPSWGIISPAEFIPLAEESGQIVEIGSWVLRNVCEQSKAWEASGYTPIPISVNFSAQQFLQKDLIENTQRILVETGVSPELIEVEITESMLLGNSELITKTLNQLRKMGMKISIDDFGTGYSSLSYLNRLPLDTLKIDRTFIKEISESPKSKSLISAIISLAHGLNMNVVAEGVETEEQLKFLKLHQCQEAQGYLFSPPVLSKDFEGFLTHHQKETSLRKGITYLENKVVRPKIAEKTTMVVANNPEGGPSQQILVAALERTKNIYSISSREMDVFKFLVNGLSNKEISDELFISEHTVKNHITRIFQKLAVSDRLQAMAKVYQACIEEGDHLHA